MFFTSGEKWKTTRRFAISSMKNLGMGKKIIEDKMIEELQFLNDKIQSFKDIQYVSCAWDLYEDSQKNIREDRRNMYDAES